MAMIGDRNGWLLRLEVDQQDISKITIGQIALVSMDAYDDKIVEGTVSFISPSMSENEQTFRVDVKSEHLPSSLYLHSAIEANIIINTRKDALVLPKNALASEDSCWVKENRKRKKIKVETGIRNLDEIEILSGLTEKTAVIVNKR
jgi:HlyD family secretion protein